MWGEENRPAASVAGFEDDGAQREVDEAAIPDDTLEPPDAIDLPPLERKPAHVYPLIRYDINDERIAELRTTFAPLVERTPENYEPRRKAIATTRALRVAIEKKRKELKEDSLRWGRNVDDAARHYREALEDIETPLQLAKDADDAEKERVKREAEDAKKRALEEQVRAEREAEEARLRAEREAEEKRLAEERAKLEAERAELVERQRKADEAARAERERVDALQAAERARLDAEAEQLKADRQAQSEAARIEREQLEADRRALDEARDLAEREDRERRARIKAEEDAKAQAERDRVAAEEARVAEAERQAALAKRIEALKPDAEKLVAYGASLMAVTPPELAHAEAQAELLYARLRLEELVARLAAFSHSPEETP